MGEEDQGHKSRLSWIYSHGVAAPAEGAIARGDFGNEVEALELLWKHSVGMCCTRGQLGLCPSPCPVQLCISDVAVSDLKGWKIPETPLEQPPPKPSDLTMSAGITTCPPPGWNKCVFAVGSLLWDVRNRVSFNPWGSVRRGWEGELMDAPHWAENF